MPKATHRLAALIVPAALTALVALSAIGHKASAQQRRLNVVVSYSLCCPSRSTFLTGQYAHNHGVMGNAAPNGGYYKLDSSNTLPVWLQRGGYMNRYGTRSAT